MSMPNVELPEVSFKKWHYWSDWADVCAFNRGFDGYVLQCRRNRSNKLAFRTVALKTPFGIAAACVENLPKVKDAQ